MNNRNHPPLVNLGILFLLVGCLALTLWGLAGLAWPQSLSYPKGLLTYLAFALCSATAISVTTLTTRLRPVTAALIIGLAIALLAGALWPVLVAVWFCVASLIVGRSTLSFLGSDVADGRTDWLTSFLVGAGLYGTAVGLLAHLSINTPGLYGFLLATPLVLGWRSLPTLTRTASYCFAQKETISLRNAWPDIAIATIALIYFVVAFFPELMFDALVMHLFIPTQLALRHHWGFDPSLYSFSLMPMLADSLFAIGYLLADETAAHLINLVFVFVLALQVRQLVRLLGGDRTGADWATLILLTTPLVFQEGSALHIESVWAAYIIWGAFWLYRMSLLHADHPASARVSGLMLGFAASAKAVTFTFLPALSIIVLCFWRGWSIRAFIRNGVALVTMLVAVGSIPYLTAYIISGNPVFPFFNGIFKSSFFPLQNFADLRWKTGVTWDLPYRITFESGRYLEARNGAPGFQWLLLLFPSLLLLLKQGNRHAVVLATVAALSVVLTFTFTSYLRYVFPAVVALTAVLAVPLRADIKRSYLDKAFVSSGLMVICFNLLFFTSASTSYLEIPFSALLGPSARDEYLESRLPIRQSVRAVNYLNHTGAPVAILSGQPFGAGLNSDVLHPNWYNFRFERVITAAQSDREVADALSNFGAEFVLLDQTWSTPERRRLVEAATTTITQFGNVAIRAVRQEYLFSRELLLNGDLVAGAKNWSLSPGAKFDPKNKVLVVSEPAPASQNVAVRGGIRYLNTVRARCADIPTQGRVQVNWHDERGAFISASINVFDCTSEWADHKQLITSPRTATLAVVYASSHTSVPIEISRVSLR